MNKKLLISVLLFFFVFTLGALANEKAKTIEFLVWKELDFSNWIIFELNVAPENFDEKTYITTDPFMIVHIPPSPDSETLFFRLQYQGYFKKTYSVERGASVMLYGKVISDVIPPSIEVLIPSGLYYFEEQNVGGNYDSGPSQIRREPKLILTRDSASWWKVVDESGGWVPDEEAIPILNSLIDSGFDIEFYYSGWIKRIWIILFK